MNLPARTVWHKWKQLPNPLTPLFLPDQFSQCLRPLLTAVALNLSLAGPLAWGRPPVKPQKDNTAVPPSAHQSSAQQSSAQQQNDKTISGFLPSASRMETDLASTLCSGLWTHSTHESCFPPAPHPLHKCRYCARTCKSKGGLTAHENKCKNRPQSPQGEPSPTLSVSPYSPDGADLDEELLDEEPPLSLAECSHLVSAYTEQPEWQDFLDSGRHTTAQTTAVSTGWAGLSLDTVRATDKETPFPALTPVTLERLMQLSPSISRLYRQLQTGKNPLAGKDDLKAFIKNADQNKGELFARGNHSLVIKWHKGPGYVFKIARSERDAIRLKKEQNLYLWLRNTDNLLLNLTTTPMRAAFNIYGKPILALRQVDGTARDRLLLMEQHHSLNERLDFALSVISHFCQMYRRFLEKDVLLADRHDDNIGFNEIPLQGRKSMGLDDAIVQVPVMLDLDPYWFGDQESRMMQLYLPTWVPVMIGLLEEVFTPVKSNSQVSESRVKVLDKIRQLASPGFTTLSSAAFLETNSHERELSFPSPRGDGKDSSMVKKTDTQSVLQSCINHWFQDINPAYSELLAEARSHIEPLLTRLNQWDSTPRTVAEWNTRLLENTGEILRWLNNWKNETEFSLLKDFTDEGIIKAPRTQGETSPRGQQILTLLSLIHGKLRCQKCSRTFTTNTEFRRHWQHHQQETLQHCEVCGGDFTKITVHKKVHTGKKPCKCKLCGKCFLHNNNLREHLRSHSGDMPFRCDHCDKYFSAAFALKRHLRNHSGAKPYKCGHCYRCFTQSGNMNRHLRTHSGYKPYKCQHCGRCFAQSNTLKCHMSTHTSDKPFSCERCGKCFSQKNNLKSHLRTHSGDKPYKCKCCGMRFSDSSNRSKHQKRCSAQVTGGSTDTKPHSPRLA